MLINNPTRYPICNQNGNTAILAILDHLYTNNSKHVINQGIIVNNVTDHYPIFATLNIHPKRLQHEKDILVRDFKHFNEQSLKGNC